MNEGFRIHTTIDADLQKVAEDSLRTILEKAEERSGYNHQTYAQYAANFRKAKANGTMSGQPAPEYLQGAVIGLNNETGAFLFSWAAAISNTINTIALCKLSVPRHSDEAVCLRGCV